jgi:hypothetical protein
MRSTWPWLAVLLVSAPHLARADVRPSLLKDHAPDAPPATLELELGFYSGEFEEGDSVTSVTSVAGMSYRLSSHFELELDWPFAFMDGGESSTFVSGNPFTAAYYVHPWSSGYARFGAGVGWPLAKIDTGTSASFFSVLGELAPYLHALNARGLWDIWLYGPETLSLVVPAQIESRHGALLLGADTAFAYLIGVNDLLDPESDAFVQLAGMLGGARDNLTAGLRLQLVWAATTDSNDAAQVSAVPFVQVDLGSAGFVYGRFVLNLDEPAGVFGDGAGVWGLYAGGGGRI